MPASLQFAHPALLFGVAAATLPLLVHWWLRQRPRRVRFPAVSFLYEHIAGGQRARRLRNVWLLLARALLLACAALLLAGPTCLPQAADAVGSQPVASVLVLDDSWSTHYRLDPTTTCLDRARQEALSMAVTWAAVPRGSQFALVRADPEVRPEGPTAEVAAILRRLRAPESSRPHAAPLGRAIRAAGRMLRDARQPARRLLVFTDGAAHAWNDVEPELLAGIDGLSVRVVVPTSERRTNIAVTSAEPPQRRHPTGTPVVVEATLAAAGLDAECWLIARDRGSIRARTGPWSVPADGTRDVVLSLPPISPGPHGLILEVEPADRLDFDQRRYAVFEAVERPTVWLVAAPDADADDPTALIVRNLLAPESLPADRQVVSVENITTGEQPAGSCEPALIVVLPGNQAIRGLSSRIEQGATVLLIPAGRSADADWPGLRPLLSTARPVVEDLSAVMNMMWEDSSPYSANDEGLAELPRCAVRRRVNLGELLEDVRVHARYADGVPAIVSRDLGRGRLFVLTTSPDPRWSDLGVRAAGLLTWLHRLVQDALGPPTQVASFVTDESTKLAFDGLPRSGLARVSSVSDDDHKPVWMRIADGVPQEPWPARRPGLYAVRAGAGRAAPLLYAVNWPAAEADLTPVSLPQLQRKLGHERVELQITDRAREETETGVLARLLAGRDPLLALPLILLLLFLTEVLLGNRPGRASASAAH